LDSIHEASESRLLQRTASVKPTDLQISIDFCAHESQARSLIPNERLCDDARSGDGAGNDDFDASELVA